MSNRPNDADADENARGSPPIEPAEPTDGDPTERDLSDGEPTEGGVSLGDVDASGPAETERERDLRAYEAVVESMGDGVVVFDPEGRVRIANRTFARPLGYAPADLLGEDIETLHKEGVIPEGSFGHWTTNLEAMFGENTRQRRFETRLRTVSGERVFEAVLTRLPTGEPDVVAVVRDVTAQRERDRRLNALHEATRDLMVADSTRTVAQAVVDAAQTILDIPIAAVRRRTADDRLELVAWTDATEARLGLDRTYTVGEGPAGRAFETGEVVIHDDLRDTEDDYDREGIESGVYLPLGEYGVVSLGASDPNGFEETDVQLATLLVTNATVAIERAERTRTLEALHDTTRRLMQAESPEEVATMAIETADDVLGFPLTGVWLYDEDTEGLESVAQSPAVREVFGEDVPTHTAGDSLLWQAFATDEFQIHEDTAAVEGTYSDRPTIRSEIIVPLGHHGVLTVGSTTAEAFEDGDIYFARVLAANTEAALDRAARERELAAQRDELATLARINALIQEIIHGLTDAATREEIERMVCEGLADAERYRFAWIGERDATTERLVPRTASALAEEYLEPVTLSTDETSRASHGPAGLAARTDELQVTRDALEDPAFASLRERVREFGFRAVAVIPLGHDRVTYGYLAVYAVEPDAFGERERTAFTVLGETIGFALNAAHNLQLLRGSTVTELTFRAPAAATLLGSLRTRLDATVTLESIVPTGEQTLQYITIDGATSDAVCDLLAEEREFAEATVEEWRVIDAHETGCRLELAVTGSAPGTLVAAGATVRTAVADGHRVRIVADAPPDADVRGMVDILCERHPGIELRATRETDRSLGTTNEFRGRLYDELTDRQRAALEAAYAAGYYDWPRESTAEDVAASMGIASPTLHSHLRKAQRKLLSALFEDT